MRGSPTPTSHGGFGSRVPISTSPHPPSNTPYYPSLQVVNLRQQRGGGVSAAHGNIPHMPQQPPQAHLASHHGLAGRGRGAGFGSDPGYHSPPGMFYDRHSAWFGEGITAGRGRGRGRGSGPGPGLGAGAGAGHGRGRGRGGNKMTESQILRAKLAENDVAILDLGRFCRQGCCCCLMKDFGLFK
ncbi:hypothetical protein AJ80_06835 [Polytolypa hystricis UAMH7299]|uniref:Uncharacterized protein n=1 Tax=Polytolypa hystricis (strain UAMH7299) TaxID=1447883 RepID=A0A2B7XK49_POLH7|nr:hypothetical protein AJ80_06835 [Polytolypa hystricis UAMH7299]